jgi:hypothetical protein
MPGSHDQLSEELVVSSMDDRPKDELALKSDTDRTSKKSHAKSGDR